MERISDLPEPMEEKVKWYQVWRIGWWRPTRTIERFWRLFFTSILSLVIWASLNYKGVCWLTKLRVISPNFELLLFTLPTVTFLWSFRNGDKKKDHDNAEKSQKNAEWTQKQTLMSLEKEELRRVIELWHREIEKLLDQELPEPLFDVTARQVFFKGLQEGAPYPYLGRLQEGMPDVYLPIVRKIDTLGKILHKYAFVTKDENGYVVLAEWTLNSPDSDRTDSQLFVEHYGLKYASFVIELDLPVSETARNFYENFNQKQRILT